ncbi:AMP-binding protein, partial [uncultured Bradyrhizobium sp.]|uniref:AMP-binding protein n=1 Tax=uncultured Bradyrhizobium sp. TaxID=199684 RepID=UPI00262607DE
PRLWEALLSGFDDALAAMPASRQRLLGAALANSRAFGRCRRQALDLTLAPEAWPARLGAAGLALLRWPLHRLAAALLWPKLRQQLVGGRLRTAISGGGALAMHVDGFFEAIGIELLVGYGLTETSPVLTCRRRWANRRGSAGQPLAGTSLRIGTATCASPPASRTHCAVISRCVSRPWITATPLPMMPATTSAIVCPFTTIHSCMVVRYAAAWRGSIHLCMVTGWTTA